MKYIQSYFAFSIHSLVSDIKASDQGNAKLLKFKKMLNRYHKHNISLFSVHNVRKCRQMYGKQPLV